MLSLVVSVSLGLSLLLSLSMLASALRPFVLPKQLAKDLHSASTFLTIMLAAAQLVSNPVATFVLSRRFRSSLRELIRM